MSEGWRPAPGYEGYEVSNLGRVRSRWLRGGSHARGRKLVAEWRIVTGWANVSGHLTVYLIQGDRHRFRPVHVLVAEAFHGARPEGQEVRHLDGDPRNNRADNLQWGSRSENMRDRVRHGTHHNAIKTHCKRGHPYDAANTYILPKSGSRTCRTCTRDRLRRAA